MQGPTITMQRGAALEKLESYEQAMRRNPHLVEKLDRGVMQGYRVLARGGRLVDVNDAITYAGLNLAGQPKLAISRAHTHSVRWAPARDSSNENRLYRPNGGGAFDYRDGGQRGTSDLFLWRVAAGTFERARVANDNYLAMTPLIPLPQRPKHKLDNYFLLWEANWHPAPPVDPYLLRPVAGALMEILAEWDVSPIELAAVRTAMQTDRR